MMSSTYTTFNNKKVPPLVTLDWEAKNLWTGAYINTFMNSNFSDFHYFGLDLQLLTRSSFECLNPLVGWLHRVGGVHISLIYLMLLEYCHSISKFWSNHQHYVKGDNSYHVRIEDIHNAHPKTSPRCHLKLWERKRNGCIANIFTIRSNFYVGWPTTTSSLFMLLHKPTTK
jgi:hypothetical protein